MRRSSKARYPRPNPPPAKGEALIQRLTVADLATQPPMSERRASDVTPAEKFSVGSNWSGFDSSQNATAATCWAAVSEELHKGNAIGNVLAGFAGKLRSAAPRYARTKIEHGHNFGRAPHAPTLMRGMPGAFSLTTVRAKPKAVRIVVTVGGNCNIDANDLLWSGAVALIVAAQAEEAGNPVEIHGVSNMVVGHGFDQPLVQAVIVKEAHESLIPDLLASVIASPRVFRLAFFAHMERVPVAMPSHGSHRELRPQDLEALGISDAIVVRSCYSREKALEELARLSTDAPEI